MPSQFRRLPAKQTRFSRKANPFNLNCKQGNFQCGAVCKPLKNRKTGKDTNCPSNKRLGMATTALAWLEDRQRRLDAVNQKREKTGRRRYEMNQGKVQPLPPTPKKMETETKPQPAPAPETSAKPVPEKPKPKPKPAPEGQSARRYQGKPSPKQEKYAAVIIGSMFEDPALEWWLSVLEGESKALAMKVIDGLDGADPRWIIDNKERLTGNGIRMEFRKIANELGLTPAPEKQGRAAQSHSKTGAFGIPKTPAPTQPQPAPKKGASPKQIAWAEGILYELTDRNPSNPNLSVTAWVGELNQKGRREYANYVEQVLGAVRKADPIWIIDNRDFLKTPAFKENVDLLGRRLGVPIEFSERCR